jgi:hypothetical protein
MQNAPWAEPIPPIRPEHLSDGAGYTRIGASSSLAFMAAMRLATLSGEFMTCISAARVRARTQSPRMGSRDRNIGVPHDANAGEEEMVGSLVPSSRATQASGEAGIEKVAALSQRNKPHLLADRRAKLELCVKSPSREL